jgi:arsenate reductase
MNPKLKALVICQHNSGRSQMAQAYLQRFHGGTIEFDSAGYEPANAVNPLVVTVMREDGIDLSGKKPQGAFDLVKQGRFYGLIITVCDVSEALCPVFPGYTRRLNHPFPDPAAVTGSYEERIDSVRRIRDAIRTWSGHFLDSESEGKRLIDSL